MISLTQPEIFAGLLLGAMLPYIFSSFTIKSVGKAAFGMVEEVRRQIREHPGILDGTEEPDYKACIAISTKASLTEMIIPGLLVIYALIIGCLNSFIYWVCIWSYHACRLPSWSHCQRCTIGHFSC